MPRCNGKWYKQKKQISRVTRDMIKINGTLLIVGNDPLDGWEEGMAKSIDAWINVSDTPCNSLEALPWKTERFWFPVAEIHRWTYHHAFWIKTVLDNLVYKRKDVKKVYIHCHAGARRSPTSLYLWLISQFGTELGAKIMNPDEEKTFTRKKKEVPRWRCKQLDMETHGHYGELMPEIELFYKVLNNYGYESFEGALMIFERITKHKLIEHTGYPTKLRERGKEIKGHPFRHLRKEFLQSINSNKYATVKDREVTYIPHKGISDTYALGWIVREAHYFYEENKCKFSRSWFYGWYMTQLIAKPSWVSAKIVLKDIDKPATKDNIEVIELVDFLRNRFNFKDATWKYNKKKYTVTVTETL